ncbi:MAG: YgjV family protein [Firmicutes bacterium]|nr:YgjV family protein [Bacillota bacterium]
MNFLLTQFIGLVGYSTLSFSYFKKEKKDILFIQIIAYIAFAIHYYMLSGITGTVCNVIGLIALIIIYLFDKYKVKNKNILVFIIIPLLILISLITYQNIYSIFPVISSTIAILSFFTDNEHTIRKVGVVAAVSWLIYAIVYKSYVSIIFEIITLSSTVIASIKNK